MLNKFSILILTLTLFSCANHRPKNFNSQMQALENKSHSAIGVSAIHIESGKALEYKADKSFKMASTMKVPIGIYVLHEAQNHKILLNEMVRIEPYDLVPGSGLMGYYLTRPGLAMSVYNMLEPMITISENSSTDILLSKVGGPYAVQQFLNKHGLNAIRIDRNLMKQFTDCKGIKELPPKSERSLQKWKSIFDDLNDNHKVSQSDNYRKHFSDDLDTTTPRAMTELLTKLYKGELLDKEHTELMLGIMGRTASGDKRIEKLLPKDVAIANKTGSWNQEQIDAFYNYTHDVGIITMPGPQGHIAVSIYTGSHKGSTQKMQEEVIAEAAKIVYDSFTE